MNIRFFGHSLTKYKTKKDNSIDTFVNIIQEKYQCYDTNNSYYGIGACSEERILFYLKKQKDISMAIIFHAIPTYVFVPGFVQDITKSKFSKDEMNYWKKTNKILAEDLTLDKANDIVTDNKQYFYHQDLQMNRFTGAMIQIDQYCTAKQIPVIHFTHNRVPDWIKFTSGIVDKEIVSKMDFTHNHLTPYFIGYENSANGINKEGNIIIADKIIEYVENYDKFIFEKTGV